MTKRAERRRDHRADERQTSKSRIPWIVGGVVLLGILIVVWDLVSSMLDDTVRAPIAVQYSTPQELLALAQGVETGNLNADVTVIEFADYQCPSCRNFFQNTKPFIDLTYIQEQQIRFVFYDYPLIDAHPNAFLAARAARCAGDQDQYWPFHDRLFQTQPDWAVMADPSGEFADFAESLGLDRGVFATCLGGDQHAEVVSANLLLGAELGVQGTPTVLIDAGDGRAITLSDWSIEGIRAVVDEALRDDVQFLGSDSVPQGTGAP